MGTHRSDLLAGCLAQIRSHATESCHQCSLFLPSHQAISQDEEDDADDLDVKRVSKIEQLWIDYEEAEDHTAIQSRLLRRALGGAMTKKGQHKAHWMDLELVTFAIRTAHGNTKAFSRDYLTQLAVQLTARNHRNTSAKFNLENEPPPSVRVQSLEAMA